MGRTAIAIMGATAGGALPALLRPVVHHPEPGVRHEEIAALLAIMRDPDFRKRPVEEVRAVTTALGGCAGDEALPYLEEQLYAPRPRAPPAGWCSGRRDMREREDLVGGEPAAEGDSLRLSPLGGVLIARLNGLLRGMRLYGASNRALLAQQQALLDAVKAIEADEVALLGMGEDFYVNGVRLRPA
ncbi:hypothetical protein [Gemmatimonas sp.]|uniref:hypothetical protein n=1 Tax=Gemmatimonas sp. TaxID=1962908 RepID=UPI0037BE46F4